MIVCFKAGSTKRLRLRLRTISNSYLLQANANAMCEHATDFIPVNANADVTCEQGFKVSSHVMFEFLSAFKFNILSACITIIVMWKFYTNTDFDTNANIKCKQAFRIIPSHEVYWEALTKPIPSLHQQYLGLPSKKGHCY